MNINKIVGAFKRQNTLMNVLERELGSEAKARALVIAVNPQYTDEEFELLRACNGVKILFTLLNKIDFVNGNLEDAALKERLKKGVLSLEEEDVRMTVDERIRFCCKLLERM